MVKSILLVFISNLITAGSLNPVVYMEQSLHYPLSVLITEIMFDPEPSIGLPGCEYIELYNNNADTVYLDGWSIMVGSRKAELPAFSLGPGSYAALVPEDCCDSFMYLRAETHGIEKWPALRNTGQDITLLNGSGEILHFATYHPSMFDDPLKRDGGWSLELSDLSNPCYDGSWKPSVDYKGGTPGEPNSLAIISYDEEPPGVLRAGLKDLDRLIIYFDEPLLPFSHEDWLRFETGIGSPLAKGWNYYGYRPDKVEVILDGIIPPAKVFFLSVDGEASDCRGNNVKPGRVKFGFPENPLPGDIIISEILYDPVEGQEEFVEVYNASSKVLAMNDLYFATTDESGRIRSYSTPTEESFLAFPGEYYLFTADGYNLELMSGKIPAGNICEREDLPSLSNSGSGIMIMDSRQVILDSARYDPDWFDSRLGDIRGFSIERINYSADGTGESNWHPASILAGGFTPGSPNSAGYLNTDTEDLFLIEPRALFYGDGYPSCIMIHTNPSGPGWIGDAGVWSLSGEKVRDLHGPASLSSNGAFKWDGSDNNGRRVPPGNYIIIINYLKPDGSKGRWKDACIVIGDF